jgi:hypothetical protein
VNQFGPEETQVINPHTLKALLDERIRQNKKWGEQNHEPMVWLAVLGEEVGEACQEALRATFGERYDERRRVENFRTELIHCAAVCIAAIESLERNELS